jgi:hypothetical protein
MTVSVPGSLTYSYAGDGSTTTFSYPVRFLANAELVVVLEDADGNQVTKTLTTHYTVSGAGNANGGSVTMLTAPAAGETLRLYRETARKQVVDLANSARNPAQSVEDQLDRFAMADQDMNGQIGRAVKVKVGSTGPVFPAPAASKIIGWNSGGTTLENKTPVDAGLYAIPATASRILKNNASGNPDVMSASESANLTTLAAVTPGAQGLAVLAHATAQQTFNGLLSSTYLTEATGGAAVPVRDVFDRVVTPQMFVSVANGYTLGDDIGDGIVNARAAIKAAMDHGVSTGARVYIPKPSNFYRLGDGVTAGTSYLLWEGGALTIEFAPGAWLKPDIWSGVTGAIFTNVNPSAAVSSDVSGLILINPQLDGGNMPASSATYNDNGFGFARGAEDITFWGGCVKNVRENHVSGSGFGGKGIQCEYGVRGVKIFGTRFENCFIAINAQGVPGVNSGGDTATRRAVDISCFGISGYDCNVGINLIGLNTTLLLELTGITGTFSVGETVTGGTSGATGTVATVSGTSIFLTATTVVGTFQAAETVTGGTSGATGTISEITLSTPQGDPEVMSFRSVGAFFKNCGSALTRPGFSAGTKEKSAAIMIGEAQNFEILSTTIDNSAYVPTYPANADLIGHGLTGDIGAPMLVNGRNGLIDGVTYYGSSDYGIMFKRARAVYDDAADTTGSGQPKNLFGIVVRNYIHKGTINQSAIVLDPYQTALSPSNTEISAFVQMETATVTGNLCHSTLASITGVYLELTASGVAAGAGTSSARKTVRGTADKFSIFGNTFASYEAGENVLWNYVSLADGVAVALTPTSAQGIVEFRPVTSTGFAIGGQVYYRENASTALCQSLGIASGVAVGTTALVSADGGATGTASRWNVACSTTAGLQFKNLLGGTIVMAYRFGR